MTDDSAEAAARKLRRLLIEPGRASLAPWRDCVYLCDEYVCLNVTGNIAVADLPVGRYKVTVAKGLTANGAVGIDVGKFVTAIEDGAQWRPVTATKWSVAESKARAMLVYIENPSGRVYDAEHLPVLINEDLWTEFHEQYGDGIAFDADARREVHPIFRVRWGTSVLAYVAGVQMPEGEGERARQLVDPHCASCDGHACPDVAAGPLEHNCRFEYCTAPTGLCPNPE
jgi:hypothetical protein